MQYGAGAVLVLWATGEIILMGRRKGNLLPGNVNNLFVALHFLIFVALCWFSTVCAPGGREEYHPWIAAAGLMITAAGIALRIFSIVTMGKHYIPNVTPQQGSVMVKSGIYAVIRHPGYLGVILLYVGLSLLLAHWLLTLYSLAGSILVYCWRISAEERRLVEMFGDEYLHYRKSSWKLIPYLY